MEKPTAELLIDFYKNYLQPEFAAIREKQAEHDEKFLEVLDHSIRSTRGSGVWRTSI